MNPAHGFPPKFDNNLKTSPGAWHGRRYNVDRKQHASNAQKKKVMKTMLQVLTETTRNRKPSFRQASNRHFKFQKHRYERRKVRELMRTGSWTEAI